MTANKEIPTTKPIPPAEHECCNSACNPCVWDRYYAKLREWRLEQAKLREENKQ